MWRNPPLFNSLYKSDTLSVLNILTKNRSDKNQQKTVTKPKPVEYKEKKIGDVPFTVPLM